MKHSLIILSLIISLSVKSHAGDNYQRSINYLVDYSYYEEFSAEVLGVYVINDSVPVQILENTYRMSQILDHYLYISKNPNFNKDKVKDKDRLSNDLSDLLNLDLFEKFSQKHYNHHPEIRDIELILEGSSKKLSINSIKNTYRIINDYNERKKNFYSRQNNSDGVAFCYDIENTILKPLRGIGYKLNPKHESVSVKDILEKDINSLNKKELKLVWDNFKDNNLDLIEIYFDAKRDQLEILDNNSSLNIKYDLNASSKPQHYFLCLKIFGQDWYLELYDDYPSDSHRVNFINL